MTEPEPRMRTDRMLASFHEAGHVIACFEYGVAMSGAELRPALWSDSCEGITKFSWWTDENKIKPRADAVLSLAGPEAERIYRARNDMGEPDLGRWESDLECARRACERGGLNLTEMRTLAYRLACRRWPALYDTALYLERHRRISAGQARGAARRAS